MSWRFPCTSSSRLWSPTRSLVGGWPKTQSWQIKSDVTSARSQDVFSGLEVKPDQSYVQQFHCRTMDWKPRLDIWRLSTRRSTMWGPHRSKESRSRMFPWKRTLSVTYTDASWNNAAHSSSQQGILVVATSREATSRTCRASLLDWRSSRSQRVCRSTLAAEASSADEGSDRAAFLNIITEVFYNQPAWTTGSRLDHIQVTDARSLYDYIIAPNPSLSDGRSLVNVRAVQEEVRPDQMWWVPTTLMFSDGLTKLNANLRSTLAQWLMNPFVKLRETEGPKKK